ncbi:Prophage PssSM-03, Orf52 [Pseudomonas syringae pv. syringae]|nr:Prophage PssSM-03, Orf52 [Pseudomonas syringae pv. syringae]
MMRPSLIPYQTDPVADTLNVVRIKAARDNGISRKAAVTELGLSNTLINRLIREFNIDYPLQAAKREMRRMQSRASHRRRPLQLNIPPSGIKPPEKTPCPPLPIQPNF